MGDVYTTFAQIGVKEDTLQVQSNLNTTTLARVQYTYNFYHLEQPFGLEMGGQIDEPIIAYHTYGTLNEARDNVIVICHALTANSDADDWWHGLFGKGDIFDWDKYFIICANNLGSPYGTTSPKQNQPNTHQLLQVFLV